MSSANNPPSPVLTSTGSTMSWFCVSSNMSMDDVRGALNSAPRVAAAPTVAYAGAPATLKKETAEERAAFSNSVNGAADNNPSKAL